MQRHCFVSQPFLGGARNYRSQHCYPTPGPVREDDQLLDGYIDHIKVERGLAPHSVEAYSADLIQFAVYVRLEAKTFCTVDTGDVAGWLISLSKGGISARSQGRKLSSVRGALPKFLLNERHSCKSTRRRW